MSGNDKKRKIVNSPVDLIAKLNKAASEIVDISLKELSTLKGKCHIEELNPTDVNKLSKIAQVIQSQQSHLLSAAKLQLELEKLKDLLEQEDLSLKDISEDKIKKLLQEFKK